MAKFLPSLAKLGQPTPLAIHWPSVGPTVLLHVFFVVASKWKPQRQLPTPPPPVARPPRPAPPRRARCRYGATTPPPVARPPPARTASASPVATSPTAPTSAASSAPPCSSWATSPTSAASSALPWSPPGPRRRRDAAYFLGVHSFTFFLAAEVANGVVQSARWPCVVASSGTGSVTSRRRRRLAHPRLARTRVATAVAVRRCLARPRVAAVVRRPPLPHAPALCAHASCRRRRRPPSPHPRWRVGQIDIWRHLKLQDHPVKTQGWLRQSLRNPTPKSIERCSFIFVTAIQLCVGNMHGFCFRAEKYMKKKGGRKIFGFMVKEEKEENWGSVEFQVFSFTNKIRRLASHLELHKKDFSSERGLRRLLGKRQRLLAYLAKKNRVRYKKLIS
uniref:Small ribosomal subunit protein uS15c n=1 Tax=Oryza sativa subsp. japonica TaxID=39947 RepID=Q2QPG5_ORYSJ|nr:ribosomal protein S15 containing protein [Oryza sativa Japonica Group]